MHSCTYAPHCIDPPCHCAVASLDGGALALLDRDAASCLGPPCTPRVGGRKGSHPSPARASSARSWEPADRTARSSNGRRSLLELQIYCKNSTVTSSGEKRTDDVTGEPSALSQAFDWAGLLQLVRDGEVVPIVGKELLTVSIDGQQTLLDPYLAQRLVRDLSIDTTGLPFSVDLNQVAVAYLQQGGLRRKLHSTLRGLVEERTWPVPEPLRQLAAISDFRLFISTTFDELLANAIDGERYGGKPQTRRLSFSTSSAREDLSGAPGALEHAQVFQILGRISRLGGYVVTEEDALEFLHALHRRESTLPALFEALRNRTLLFLGCGFPDGLARCFLRMLVNRPLSSEEPKFVIDHRAKLDLDLALFLRQCRIETHPAGDPVPFVAELYARWQQESPRGSSPIPGSAPGAASGGGRTAGNKVFLSYANEDLVAAQNLYTALVSQNVEVWMDRHSLPTGDAWPLTIPSRIADCALFLPLLSKEAARRDEGHYRNEWKSALNRGVDPEARFILPVAIDDIEQGANGIPKEFHDLQWHVAPQGRPTQDFIQQVKEAIKARQLRSRGFS